MKSKSHGLLHWKLQRISAIAMIPLVIWFVSSLISTLINGYDQSVNWLQSPINATGLVFLFGTLYLLILAKYQTKHHIDGLLQNHLLLI